jgi:hypothetical protein
LEESVTDSRQKPPEARTPLSGPPDASLVSEDIEELESTRVSSNLLEEISSWKREARSEDNDRYFWHVKEVDQIARGGKYFVIGRKGSGKTAICEYFNRRQQFSIFAEKLSFKNFPFNELYSHTNKSYTPPNQFISIWKYLIYSTICRLMLRNEAVNPEVRAKLGKLYGETSPLSRRVGQWVGKEFGMSLFGLSVKVTKERSAAPDSWIESANYLEDIILEYSGDATYFVLFDELDEDYRDIIATEQYQQYTALITSLFKAVQDIRSTIGATGPSKIYPVIFLRDDIYDLILDSDKNKWGDFRVDLNWDEARIKKVLAFRLSRAINPTSDQTLVFSAAWEKVFGRLPIGRARGNKISTFDYIARSTLLRPRDFVAYLQNCAQQALDDGTMITNAIVRRVDKAFSNYLREELTDELFAILPDISAIFDTVSQLRKWNFSVREFQKAYSRQKQRGSLKERDVNFVLQILFLFDVVGNSPNPGRYVFHYKNREARLNFNEQIVVHRGLFKALQII